MKRIATTFTLVELAVVLAMLWGLGLFFGQAMIIDPQIKANEVQCKNNLKQLGMQLLQAKQASAITTSGYTSANATTLAPIRDMVAGGYISEKSLLTCPVGHSGYTVADFDNKEIGLKTQKDTAADKLKITKGSKTASNYLFTLFYSNRSKGNRVIAGDAADSSAKGKNAFSPNHSDTAQKKRRGAIALFMDGHVKSAANYHVAGASDKTNLWGNESAPSSEKEIAKTQIGHY